MSDYISIRELENQVLFLITKKKWFKVTKLIEKLEDYRIEKIIYRLAANGEIRFSKDNNKIQKV